ncbi:Serine/Threonine kinase catalytic domain protein [Rhizoctonia solani 123E]|uniref:Serine/Threonine kinase catalytic domain protein n=1 Tax=Rhizoctonia solani 123E TaxID=1423351 RepID=A0A074RUJ8_9AGAM|nr:Serine/Threonine kinase catalytic domain protein [Rhizoctonia solani 123E]
MGISTYSEELGIKATHPGELGVKDLTPQLDNSCFSEWPIARGGFGEIWKGALTRGRPIAVKRLTMYSAAGDEGVKKIRKVWELAIWSKLKHPNVLPLMGTCLFRGSMGLVSEWQDNGNATEWVRANPGVDRLELVCLTVVIENLKLMDRYILQGNVIISKKGRPRLIDFGLASITDNSLFSASSTLVGTLRWMAPELQVTEGQGTTKAGDMFAFGMELFTGLPPFSTVKNDIAVLLKYQNGDRPSRPSPTRDGIKNSTNNQAETPPIIPKERGKTGDVCVFMDDDTWCQVEKCWAQDPLQRSSTNETLEWFIWKRKRQFDQLD